MDKEPEKWIKIKFAVVANIVHGCENVATCTNHVRYGGYKVVHVHFIGWSAC